MNQLTWDDKDWPILVVQFPEGLANKDIIMECRTYFIELFERKKPFVVVAFHEPTSGTLDTKTRELMALFHKKYSTELHAYLKGFAVVSSSMVARTALMVIEWVAPFPYPAKAFKTRDEASRWAKQRLAS